ncbi:MAG: protein kinase [archaeon]|nr:protein kinase [archaeon]
MSLIKNKDKENQNMQDTADNKDTPGNPEKKKNHKRKTKTSKKEEGKDSNFNEKEGKIDPNKNTSYNIDDIIAKNFVLISKIGHGAFGEIFLSFNLRDNIEVAVKKETFKNEKIPQLRTEAKIYQSLLSINTLDISGENILQQETVQGIAKFYGMGELPQFSYLILEFLGPNLIKLMNYCDNKKFTIVTVCLLALQILNRIEYLHKHHFLHRDIKPENFLIGTENKSNIVYLIDFGLSKRYKNPKNHQHIPYREGRLLTGTARYVSINTHLGIEQSRRDDLESIGYVLIYFLKGCLPWQGLGVKDKYAKIMEKKLQIPTEILCFGLPDEFSIYLNYCKNLRFEDRPDYDYLRGLFLKAVTNCTSLYNISKEYMKFDWCFEDQSVLWNMYNSEKNSKALNISLANPNLSSGANNQSFASSHKKVEKGEIDFGRPLSKIYEENNKQGIEDTEKFSVNSKISSKNKSKNNINNNINKEKKMKANNKSFSESVSKSDTEEENENSDSEDTIEKEFNGNETAENFKKNSTSKDLAEELEDPKNMEKVDRYINSLMLNCRIQKEKMEDINRKEIVQEIKKRKKDESVNKYSNEVINNPSNHPISGSESSKKENKKSSENSEKNKKKSKKKLNEEKDKKNSNEEKFSFEEGSKEKKSSAKESSNSKEAFSPTRKISLDQQNMLLAKENLIKISKDKVSKYYEVLNELGQGSYGKVKKVRHIKLNEIRAMKIVSKKSTSSQNEIEILRKVSHPNIINIFEIFEDSRQYYIMSEYCEGGELFDAITNKGFYNEKDASGIFTQLLQAVNYLHCSNIVHRDLKPENIMLLDVEDTSDSRRKKTEIKLIDFGTACAFKKGQRFNKFIGTSYYLAPEVIKENYDEKCDVWSCGIILYILLCGYPPFNGSSNNEIYNAIKYSNLIFNEEEWKDVSKEAIDLIKKMLEKDPNKRPSTEQCLKHKWFSMMQKMKFSRKHSIMINKTGALQKMALFSQQNKFKQAVLQFISTEFNLKSEEEELKKMFKEFDKDKKGIITKEDFISQIELYNNNRLSQDALIKIFESIDLDNSGTISYNEFLTMFLQDKKVLTKERLEKAFKMLDLDENGLLSVSEIKSFFGGDEKTWIKVLKEVDKNGDGEVDFEEFQQLMVGFNPEDIVCDETIFKD